MKFSLTGITITIKMLKLILIIPGRPCSGDWSETLRWGEKVRAGVVNYSPAETEIFSQIQDNLDTREKCRLMENEVERFILFFKCSFSTQDLIIQVASPVEDYTESSA